MVAPAKPPRIASMDQFRGYTVAGMFLVNFLGGYAAIHPVLKHNNTYFSYADSIMPSFMFAVGFSFRLTYLRRRSQSSLSRTLWTYVRRSLALVVVSLVMYGFGGHFKEWPAFDRMPSEFESFRAKPAATQSFDMLLKRARKENPAATPGEATEAASKIGALIKEEEPKKKGEKERFAVAQAAARNALGRFTTSCLRPSSVKKPGTNCRARENSLFIGGSSPRRCSNPTYGRPWRSSGSRRLSSFPLSAAGL